MLITASWVEKVKERIGLTAVSPFWGDTPSWYFWISQRPGAFLLELDEIVDENWESDLLAGGMFKIKYYPHPHGEGLEDFSFEEQAFVQSDFFDHTHTPRFEKKESIPDSLFNVAALEVTMDPKDNLALFSLEALDTMQITYDRAIYRTYPEFNKGKQYIAGEQARNVPGYDLGYTLFSSLASLYSFYSKTKPTRVLATHGPGFKHVCNSSNQFHCIDTDEINLNSLHILFSDNSKKSMAKGEKLVEQRCKEADHEVVFDQQFTYGQSPGNCISPFVNKALDENWWFLAEADYKSDLASSCGCESCHK